MSFSGFVYSELRPLNGLGLFRNQSVGLEACDKGFDRVGCRLENRELDCLETQPRFLYQMCDLVQVTSSLPDRYVLEIE